MNAEAVELHFTPTSVLRLWTGDYPLSWQPPDDTEARTWTGMKLIGIDALDAPSVDTARRAQISMAVNESADIKRFIPDPPANVDPGPFKIVIRLLHGTETPSADEDSAVALTWSQDLRFTGRASAARMSGGTISVDISSPTQSLGEQTPLYYSDASQQAFSKTPSPDRGMEYARQVADSEIIERWPNR